MGFSIGIHPPKTPVTEGSRGVAKATIPNICKMPGPPAPFVPAPLPNIGKSELSPKDYSKTVKMEGKTVAIRGATFESIGDMASKGTGGGLISANTHGPTKFITPGSMTVKIEGKNVHLLGEPMLNNCGPSGSPPNTGATMMGVGQGESKKPECNPHEIVFEPLTEDGQKARNDRIEAKKTNLKAKIKAQRKIKGKAYRSTPPNMAAVNECDRLIAEYRRAIRAEEYEQKVAKEGKGKWAFIEFKCIKAGCQFSGDIDALSSEGNIKECKSNGLPDAGQVKKYKIVGPLIFGTAFKGIHLALPKETMRSFADSCKTQKLEGQISPQPHEMPPMPD